MWYLINTLFGWLLLALALGLVIGWVFGRYGPREKGGNDGPGLFWWLLVVAALAAALIALNQWFRGASGFWTDAFFLMAAAYFLGCCFGCVFKRWLGTPEGSGGGLLALAGIGAATPLAAPSPTSAPAAKPAPAPAQSLVSAPPAAPTMPGMRPIGIVAPRGGKPDDLSRLPGIDVTRMAKLHGLGIYHYDQICEFGPDEREWVFAYLDLGATQGLGAKAADYAGWRNACVLTGKGGPAFAVSPTPTTVPAPTEAGEKPVGLSAPRGGKADNLKLVRGIGKQNEGRLHGLGIWHFDQIAAWTPANALWVGAYLAFPGRIEREEWVAQAKALARGEMTEFAKRAASGKVATSADDGSLGQGNVEETLKPMRSQKGDAPKK